MVAQIIREIDETRENKNNLSSAVCIWILKEIKNIAHYKLINLIFMFSKYKNRNRRKYHNNKHHEI